MATWAVGVGPECGIVAVFAMYSMKCVFSSGMCSMRRESSEELNTGTRILTHSMPSAVNDDSTTNV